MTFETGGMRVSREESGNFLIWCTSESGRVWVGRKAILVGTVGLTAVAWAANIFLMDSVRDAYNANLVGERRQSVMEKLDPNKQYKVGVLSEAFQKLFMESQVRAGVEDETFEKIDIFYTSSLDPVHAGCAAGRQGAVVGLPGPMLGEAAELDTLRVRPTYTYFHKGYRLPSSLCEEARTDLRQTLVLTQPEREFLIAREVARVDSWAAVRETAMYPLLFITHYMMARQINTNLGLFGRSRMLRWGIQAGFAAASLAVLVIAKNFHMYESDLDAITRVCQTSQQAEVAVGFYQKTLDRNKVLRQVLGPEGDGGYCFTEEGEIKPLFYEMPICTSALVRRDFCQKLVHQLD